MQRLEALRDLLPPHARDLRLNLPAVLLNERLALPQRWGTALAAACFRGHAALVEALRADATHAGVSPATLEDAEAAAAIMAMNTTYYTFRHLAQKDIYAQMAARLRMQRIAAPASTRADFELFCLACAVLAGCEYCVRSHEHEVTSRGVTEQQVHDAVRIAAVMEGIGVALRLPPRPATPGVALSGA